VCALTVVGLMSAPAPALAAPSITVMSLSQDEVRPGDPIVVTVAASQASNWRMDLLSECGGPGLRTLLGYSASPQWSIAWDGFDSATATLPVGEYRMRLTLVDAGGAAITTPADRTFSVLGDGPAPFCPNVSLLPDTDVFAQGMADFAASGATSALITSATDIGYAAIASTYAHRYGVPLILLTKTASTKALASALAKRGAKAVLVGPPSAVSTDIETMLKAKRIKVVRLVGADRAGTAALVATRIKPKQGSAAVYVPLGGAPALVAVAAACANALGLPLLGAGATLSRYTTDAVTSLGLVGGVAIGDSTDLADKVIARLPGVSRVIGSDLASTSFVLTRAIPVGASNIVIDAAPRPDPAALVLRSRMGEPLLLLDADGLSTAQKAWFTARQELTSASVSSRVPRNLALALGRLMADRGAVGALPALQAKPALPITVPAQFTFSGSGFGHGVGMSQWGAYGMAKESYTATQILQHYFTGSVVSPVRDDVELNVSLDSRVGSESFRLEKLADPASTLEMTAADGTVTLLTVGDVVRTTYSAGKIAVSITGVTPVTAFSTTSLTFKWPGNRDSGAATGGPAILRVAGPGASIASGSRYRYGTVSVTVAKLSGGLALGLQVNNILRLHDEYLYGIAEVGSSWPMAALQTEIIAARSYAYRKYKSGIRSACACNVYDDPRDQNFTGYAKLAEKSGGIDYGARWKAAVDGTAVSPTQGQALTVGGSVVSAYYSAASGGMTQNNEDVWGGSPLPYTRSVDDPWSLAYASASVSRWTPRSFSQATIAAAFGAPDVAYLDLGARYGSGAVDTITAVSSNGQHFVLGAETFKSRLNRGLSDGSVLARGIPSVWLWRVDTDVPTSSPAAAAIQVSSGTTSIATRLPAASSPTVVIVQAPTGSQTSPVLTLAAAFAGTRNYALLVNSSTVGLDPVIRSDLTRRKATKVVFIGPVPAGVRDGVLALKIAATSYDATTPAALSAVLAAGLAVPTGTPIVVAASGDSTAAALAVSLAVRGRQPLLFIDGGQMSSEVSSYIMQVQPGATTVVGAADVVPDVAVAGIGTVKRLTTGDPVLASIIAASQFSDTATVGVVVANPLAPVGSAVIAAASGLPFYFAVDALPDETLALRLRMPAFTLILRVGVDSLLVQALRRA
jgi:SpoIID/LytB domain protein